MTNKIKKLISAKLFRLVVLVLTICTPVFAQVSDWKSSDLTWKKQLMQKVDDLFDEWDKKDSPGCAVAVIKNGELMYKRGYGMANLDYNIPIKPETVFNVASVSKQFTAMSIALLAQQGKISLDDNIRQYVPEFPAYQNPISIRHLVYHTSGIRDYDELIEFSDNPIENIHTDKDILNILARQKRLNFQPGEQHLYSNSGYVLMGIIVERVSGKTLSEFQNEFIFHPLGMKNSVLYDDRTMIVKNRATGYLPKSGGYKQRASLWDRIGASGLLTTVEDLYLWDKNFYEPKVGNSELIKQLTAPGTLNNGDKFEYAFGLEPIFYKGLPVVMHGGGIRGFRSQMYRFPNQKFTAVCLCNNGAISPTEMVERIADIYLAEDFKEVKPTEKKPVTAPAKEVKISEKQLSRFAGLYANPLTQVVRRLSVREGKLRYFRNSTSESELAPLSTNRFAMVGVTDNVEIVFTMQSGNRSPQMSVIINDAKPLLYEAVKPAFDSPAQLAEYAGTYYSAELDTKYTVIFRENKLALQKKAAEDLILSAQYADTFTSADSLANIKFLRNRNDRVSGFVLDASRIKGLYFTKYKITR